MKLLRMQNSTIRMSGSTMMRIVSINIGESDLLGNGKEEIQFIEMCMSKCNIRRNDGKCAKKKNERLNDESYVSKSKHFLFVYLRAEIAAFIP